MVIVLGKCITGVTQQWFWGNDELEFRNFGILGALLTLAEIW